MRQLLALLLFTEVALAAPKSPEAHQARAAYQRGMRHYNLSEFEPALLAFKDAYRAVPDPTLLFNIAQCQRQLKQHDEAIRTYRAFLREASNVPNRAEVEKLIASLERAVAEQEEARGKPPQGALQPVESVPSPAPIVTVEPSSPPPPPSQDRPVPAYKKWWVWTIVGVAAGAALAVGLGVGLAPLRVTYPPADTPDGRVQF